MSACRCIICDGATVARRGEPEAAIATACMVALTGVAMGGIPASAFERLATLKASLCEDHRKSWPLLLLKGGLKLDEVAEVEFSGSVRP